MAVLLSEPIESVIGRAYGPNQPRRGDHSRRLWWACPFHDDRNPSLCVEPGKDRYRCFGCGAAGDAIDFVRRLNPGMGFGAAVRAIGGDPSGSPAPRPHTASSAASPPRLERPAGWQDFARGVVSRAEGLLWSDGGSEAMRYLAGRGLTEDTIRAARLGYRPEDEWFSGIDPDRRVYVPAGVVIPWFDGPDVTLINLRRAEGRPKYQAVRGSRRDGLYPGREGIVAGKPLVIVEGELDALLLGQELRGLAAVVTLGSAGTRPSARVLNAMLGASPWVVAGDADGAGDESADHWLSRFDRCVRVAPPAGKDWTESRERGIDLRAWWQAALDRLAGHPMPPDDPEPPASSATVEDAEAIAEGRHAVEAPARPGLPPGAWRDLVGIWPVEWRQRWGYLANRHCHEGMMSWEAEVRAAQEVLAEREAAEGGPPPVMDPDPRTALARDLLEEMIADGKAAQSLSPEGLRDAKAILTATPLDGDAIQAVVHRIIAGPKEGPSPPPFTGPPGERGLAAIRWECRSPFCLHKGRWWLSAHGAVLCMNCRPPQFPSLVIAEGDTSTAPFVERHRPTQACKPYPVPVKSKTTGKPADVAGPIAHASTP